MAVVDPHLDQRHRTALWPRPLKHKRNLARRRRRNRPDHTRRPRQQHQRLRQNARIANKNPTSHVSTPLVVRPEKIREKKSRGRWWSGRARPRFSSPTPLDRTLAGFPIRALNALSHDRGVRRVDLAGFSAIAHDWRTDRCIARRLCQPPDCRALAAPREISARRRARLMHHNPPASSSDCSAVRSIVVATGPLGCRPVCWLVG